MSIILMNVPSYVKAVEESSLKERSKIDYQNCLQSELHYIKGNIVFFRNYMNDDEYWEFAFERVAKGNIKYLFIRYGCEE